MVGLSREGSGCKNLKILGQSKLIGFNGLFKKNYPKISFGPHLKFFARLKTWAKPPLKSMVLTVIRKFVVLYNNYLFAAKFLALITIIFL